MVCRPHRSGTPRRRGAHLGLLAVLPVLGILVAVSCSAPPAGPPEIVLDRTVCDRCSMLVSEPGFAAAFLVPGADSVRVFDDAACLFAALAEEPQAGQVRLWFQDAAGGGWMEAPQAVFVRTSRSATPMGSGVFAFREAADAHRFARQQDAEILSFAALRERLTSEATG